jgi:hypothetical protein
MRYKCHKCELVSEMNPDQPDQKCRRCESTVGYKFSCCVCSASAVLPLNSNRFRCSKCSAQAFTALDYGSFQSSPRALVSTGDIPHRYAIAGLVFAYADSSAYVGGISTDAAYAQAATLLMQKALAMGADGVIHVRFDYRMAIGNTIPFLNLTQRVFEILGYGTAVKTLT